MTIRTVGIVGFGVIGQRWAAAFAHAGLAVRVYDPAGDRMAAFALLRESLFADLDALGGVPARRGDITACERLEDALAGVDFVQECGPERLDLKQQLLPEIETAVRDDVIIASSSSALFVSDMQIGCRLPERIVLGHPFNPAHLMPLVEVVGGARTSPATVATAMAFYEAIGKKPVRLNREVTGHLALRLMAAMWREAIALVREGVADVADVDRAFLYGPGPKWTLQGAFISNQLNAAGMTDFLTKYGPTYEAIWATLLDARLDAATIDAVAASTARAVAGRSDDELKRQREAGLITILQTVAAHGAL